MILQELDELREYSLEENLIKTMELIGDKITFRGYSEKEVLLIVLELISIDIFTLSYEGREELLSIICDAVSNYNIRNKVDWSKIVDNIDLLETDLKEYVTEYFM